MVTRFDARMQGHPLTRFFDLRGEALSAGYTSYGNAAATLTVIIDELGIMDEERADGRVQVKRIRISCQPSEVTTPDERDLFTIAGKDYPVTAIVTTTPYVVFDAETILRRYYGSLQQGNA